MGVAWLSRFLVSLFILANAACSPASDVTAPPVPRPSATVTAIPAPVPRPSATVTAIPAPVPRPSATVTAIPAPVPRPSATVTAIPAPVPRPSANTTANPDAEGAVTAFAALAGTTSLLEAAQNSTFHQFGDDVYTWNSDRKIVILKMPVDHPALEEIRNLQGHTDGNIEDTPESRSWVQQCARYHADPALNASDAVYGAVTAQSVSSCLGGFAHLIELFARYWWTDSGVACVADEVTAHSLRGDALPRPLSICPSVGYDPAALQHPGWLHKRCADIVAANPNSRYPTDPAVSQEPLPSCWAPLVEILEDQAAENVEIGFPDSPHDCYHAFLGYVWARQTGRDSRPPNDLAIGCHYRAFEAIP